MDQTAFPPTPTLRHVTDIHVDISPPIDMAPGQNGQRRMVPILGGIARGPRLNGQVLGGGADFQCVRPDGVTEIQARYIVETEDGARIYVENTGLRHAPDAVMQRLNAGEPVDPSEVYFMARPRFEVTGAAYQWMERSIFVCSGARYPDVVHLRFFEVI